MIKVIETNLIPSSGSFQSRVIEVESWDELIHEYKIAKSVSREAYIGSMYGTSIPQNASVWNLEYNEYSLKCEIVNFRGEVSRKYVYLVE